MMYKEIYDRFNDGDKILNTDLKEILQEYYHKYGIDKIAFAKDIRLFGFFIKPTRIEKTICDGVVLIKRKDWLD